MKVKSENKKVKVRNQFQTILVERFTQVMNLCPGSVVPLAMFFNFTFSRSLSLSHVHFLMFTFSPSPSHFLTFTFSLSHSHFHSNCAAVAMLLPCSCKILHTYFAAQEKELPLKFQKSSLLKCFTRFKLQFQIWS